MTPRPTPLLAASALVASVVLSSCSSRRDLETADAAVDAFHHDLDADRVDAIVATGSAQLVKDGGSQRLRWLLKTIHGRLGAVRTWRHDGWRVTYGTGGEIVNLGARTVFASGPATEQFTFRKAGGRLQLSGYHISADALLAPAPAPAAPPLPVDARRT